MQALKHWKRPLPIKDKYKISAASFHRQDILNGNMKEKKKFLFSLRQKEQKFSQWLDFSVNGFILNRTKK
jgi:hypothetical protein